MNRSSINKSKFIYPLWVQYGVSWLSLKVLGIHPEIERAFLNNLQQNYWDLYLKSQSLWAAGHRIWLKFGHDRQGLPKDDPEWLDLQNSLSDVNQLQFAEIVGKPKQRKITVASTITT